MAGSSGDLGNLNLRVTADPQPAKAALKEVEQSAKQAARELESVSTAAQAGMKQTAASTEEASKAASGFLKTLSGVREIVSKVFAPAAIAGAIVALVKKFEEASAAADKFRGTLEGMLVTYQQIGEAQAKAITLTPDEKSIDAIRQAASKAREAIQAEGSKAEAEAREAGPGGTLWRMFTGGLSPDELAALTDEAVSKVAASAEMNIARERERQRSERAKQAAEEDAKWWIDAMKEVEAYREKVEKDRLDAIEDRKQAEIKEAKEAEAAAKRLAEFQRKSVEAMQASVSSAVSAMRNQFDQMASSVGRLVEIAESQRLNGKH